MIPLWQTVSIYMQISHARCYNAAAPGLDFLRQISLNVMDSRVCEKNSLLPLELHLIWLVHRSRWRRIDPWMLYVLNEP